MARHGAHLANSLFTVALWLKAGGSIRLKTGSHSNGIGQRVPGINRMPLFSWALTKCVLVD